MNAPLLTRMHDISACPTDAVPIERPLPVLYPDAGALRYSEPPSSLVKRRMTLRKTR
jgi:hypothetical protein